MPTGNVIVTVVDVGQGQCTFVEIYDTGMVPVLVQTLLFDCGTNKKSNQTEINIDYIVARITGMAIPTIDCLFFSHGDTDHTSLIWGLLDRIDVIMRPNKLIISNTLYGGDFSHYNKSSKNILNSVVSRGYCQANTVRRAGGANFSNYNPLTQNYAGSLWQSTDNTVVVYAICVNVLSDEPDWNRNDLRITGSSPEEVNRISLVAALYYAEKSYVICGDTTFVTMSAVIKRFNNDPPLFNGNVMVTLPHHGARATGFAVSAAEQSSLITKLIVNSFADQFQSDTISVSSYKHHGHPSLELMSTFLPKLKTPVLRDFRLTQRNTHRITANIDYDISLYDEASASCIIIEKTRAGTFEARTNIFTTHYSVSGQPTFSYEIGNLMAEHSQGLIAGDPAINNFACWQYTTESNGAYSLSGYGNLSFPLTTFTDRPEALANLALKAMEEPKALSIPTTAIIRSKAKPKAVAITNKPVFNQGLKHFL